MNLSFLRHIPRLVLSVAAAWAALSLLGLALDFSAVTPVWAMSLVTSLNMRNSITTVLNNSMYSFIVH